MNQLDEPSEKRKSNPVTEIDKDVSGLVCIECNVKAISLYQVDNYLFCVECAESHLRRERFKEEDGDWDKI